MKYTRHRLFGLATAALTMAGAVAAPIAAQASEDGRRNTTLALGALTGYLFTRGGSKVPAFLGAAGTAYAYKRYNDSINDRHKRERAWRNAQYYSRSRYSDSRRDYYRRHHRDSSDRYDRFEGRHDNGRHLGWYKGKGNPHRR